jgi:hypothetical protein
MPWKIASEKPYFADAAVSIDGFLPASQAGQA